MACGWCWPFEAAIAAIRAGAGGSGNRSQGVADDGTRDHICGTGCEPTIAGDR